MDEMNLVSSDIALHDDKEINLVSSDIVLSEDAVEDIVEAIAQEDELASGTPSIADADNHRHLKVAVELPRSTLVSPRSLFEGFEPRAPCLPEQEAVARLLRADPQRGEDFVEFELDQFACYVKEAGRDFEMRALHDHATATGRKHFLFDGYLRASDGTQFYVHKVKFDEIPLGNYGQDEHTIGDQVWIRSELNKKRNIYYKLRNPSLEYVRYHKPFLWVADLAKHLIDYCGHQIEQSRNISIHHLKKNFAAWLNDKHGDAPEFLEWYQQRKCDDFRQSLIANWSFVCKEAFGVLGPAKSRKLQFYREIQSNFYNARGCVSSRKTGVRSKQRVGHTIVTPYVYDLFKHLQLLELLEPVVPSVSTAEAVKSSWPENQPQYLEITRRPKISFPSREAMIDSIVSGDVISTPPDEEDAGTKWMTERLDKKWFGLVQKVHHTTKGRRFDVIWLYQPDDTPCCSMRYPHENELFLGNHCTCQQTMSAKVSEDQVLNAHCVEWFGDEQSKAEFFVRQTYTTEDRRFVTLKQKHLRCQHGQEDETPTYAVGDTVLVSSSRSHTVEPHELLAYLNDGSICLRRLRRRREFDDQCAPNELVYTEEQILSSPTSIMSRCIIRFYKLGDKIPPPYNRGGAGNAFFITHRLQDDGSLQPITAASRPALRQGFDPSKAQKKLRALDLFAGCGNFGRGLEDGGAVQAKWANDIWGPAIHTYMANTHPATRVNPFLGSIDDLLLDAFQGKFTDAVPRPGQVDVISGGSPCPGFSLMTADKSTIEQIKNRSLIASFASCVDFWRPQWGILENVKTIVQSGKFRTEDFFSQLVCAIVGMGYQAQIILGDAWAHGDPQGRIRAFLCFAAPGVELPRPPYPSHSNPLHLTTGNLGKMTNGEPYVERFNQPTAFSYITAGDATADLPDIYDAQSGACIPFPDHRLSVPISTGDRTREGGVTQNRRTQIFNIPSRPYNMNFSRAWYVPRTEEGEPDMFPHERDAFPTNSTRTEKRSNGWGRLHPKKLFSTVTTFCHMTDAFVGNTYMHWDQPRPLSIMEVRRAQGIPDDEVLVAIPREQWKLVGNAVARGISTALGLVLREAAFGSLYEDGELTHGGEMMPSHLEEETLDIPWVAVDEASTAHHEHDEEDAQGSAVAFADDEAVANYNVYRSSSRSTPVASTSTPATSVAEYATHGSQGSRKRAPTQESQFTAAEPKKRARTLGTVVIADDEQESHSDDGTEHPLQTALGATIVRLSPDDSDDMSFW